MTMTRATTAPVSHADRFFIGGEWVDPAGEGTIEVLNPTTGTAIARIPEGTPEDADRAVRAARAAFDSWAAVSPYQRAQLCLAIGAKLTLSIERSMRKPLSPATSLQSRSICPCDIAVAARLASRRVGSRARARPYRCHPTPRSQVPASLCSIRGMCPAHS